MCCRKEQGHVGVCFKKNYVGTNKNGTRGEGRGWSEFGKFLLSFGAEYFVFQFVAWNLKD